MSAKSCGKEVLTGQRLMDLTCCRAPRFLQKYVPIIEKLPPEQRFLMRRALENWRFGAGEDYRL